MLNLYKNFKKLANAEQPNSLSTKLRQKRFTLFESFIDQHYGLNPPSCLRIIDVGGRPTMWEKDILFQKERLANLKVEVTVVNIKLFQSRLPHIKCYVGDAKDMKKFKDKEFDVAFSNSLIEHVGKYDDQLAVAKEIMRIGKTYFVQTPNRYFPIEPHFLFPFFQFLPRQIKIWLVTNFELGRGKAKNIDKAIRMVDSIQLLTGKELLSLFPGSALLKEKFFGWTKSFIVYSSLEMATVKKRPQEVLK
jgi:hypothetical protein